MRSPLSARVSRARFEDAAARLGATREIDAVHAQLTAAHTTAARVLHDLAYVARALEVFDDVASSLARPAEIEIALWFRDIVYATHPLARSEARSADAAYASCLRMGVHEPVARSVRQLVAATGDHALAVDADAEAMIDIDLAVLGSAPLAYAAFERDLRAEHRWLTFEGVYRAGRARVLRDLLARCPLFRHPRLRDRFEAQARRNIESALAELGASDDAPRVHADDEHVFTTRAGRLVDAAPWSSVYHVTFMPSHAGRPASFQLGFGPLDDAYRSIAENEAHASEVIARVRSLPDYDHDAEARARRSGERMCIVYSQARRHPAADGPVRLPSAPVGEGVYR